tara:strand:- start:318 stop:479 length:162 start_codon:yes stop_codon:yes gene_type:complete
MNKTKKMRLDPSGVRFERTIDKSLFGNIKIIEDAHITWDVTGSRRVKQRRENN